MKYQSQVAVVPSLGLQLRVCAVSHIAFMRLGRTCLKYKENGAAYCGRSPSVNPHPPVYAGAQIRLRCYLAWRRQLWLELRVRRAPRACEHGGGMPIIKATSGGKP